MSFSEIKREREAFGITAAKLPLYSTQQNIEEESALRWLRKTFPFGNQRVTDLVREFQSAIGVGSEFLAGVDAYSILARKGRVSLLERPTDAGLAVVTWGIHSVVVEQTASGMIRVHGGRQGGFFGFGSDSGSTDVHHSELQDNLDTLVLALKKAYRIPLIIY